MANGVRILDFKHLGGNLRCVFPFGFSGLRWRGCCCMVGAVRSLYITLCSWLHRVLRGLSTAVPRSGGDVGAWNDKSIIIVTSVLWKALKA
jgi:hypothetical protein